MGCVPAFIFEQLPSHAESNAVCGTDTREADIVAMLQRAFGR